MKNRGYFYDLIVPYIRIKILYINSFFCVSDLELEAASYEIDKEVIRVWKIMCTRCLNFKEIKMV